MVDFPVSQGFWTYLMFLAILCALFGMVKWPFQGLSDLQRLGIKRSRLESPGGILSMKYCLLNSDPYNCSCLYFFDPFGILKCSCQQSVCRHCWQVSLPRKDPESYLEPCGKSYPIQKHKNNRETCVKGPNGVRIFVEEGGGPGLFFLFVWNQGINESTFISLFFQIIIFGAV